MLPAAAQWWDDRLPDWTGREVYLLGGGSSLHAFDFKALAGRAVLGCNYAFSLGPSVVSLVLFADYKFFETRKEMLRTCGVPCASILPHPAAQACNWLIQLQREKHMATLLPAVGFNNSTGAAALNLALLLGASTVYLLGIDLQPGRLNNWHTFEQRYADMNTQERHKNGWKQAAMQASRLYPSARVVNLVMDQKASALECFPKELLSDHFKEVLH